MALTLICLAGNSAEVLFFVGHHPLFVASQIPHFC